MTPGESLISLLLIVIAYLLYTIAKQLSYLTGRKIKISFLGRNYSKTLYSKLKPLPKEKDEKLPN